jgi:hypothetical protein
MIRFKWKDARSASPAQVASTLPRYTGTFEVMAGRGISWFIAAAVAIWPAAALAADLPAEPKPAEPKPATEPAPAPSAILPPNLPEADNRRDRLLQRQHRLRAAAGTLPQTLNLADC